MLKKFVAFTEFLFFRFWWVALFTLFCYTVLEQGLGKVNTEYSKLNDQLVKIQTEKIKAFAKQEDLLLQVNSQSDPAWVELLLMKGLGVVPEGQIKVLFKNAMSGHH